MFSQINKKFCKNMFEHSLKIYLLGMPVIAGYLFLKMIEPDKTFDPNISHMIEGGSLVPKKS
jgi:hypothetical protein